MNTNGTLKHSPRAVTAVVLALLIAVAAVPSARAESTNVDPNDRWAWNDAIGWIDFYSTNKVVVKANKVQGYADSSIGYISLDCSSGPPGSNCSKNYTIVNDGSGNLSGWAWNDAIGWISFSCRNPETGGSAPDYSCANTLYQVTIDALGEFNGWAWNDAIGWISFNCANAGTNGCADPGVSYRVRTSWASGGPVTGTLESSTLDTGAAQGVSFNALIWDGALNGGTVKFQLATSHCPNGAIDAPSCLASIGWGGAKVFGEGAFVGPSDGSNSYYAPNGPGIPVALTAPSHDGKRYFRYRAYLESAPDGTSPVVNDVIINWSP
ncbi:MAG: hypothetical protein HY536_01710 [Candidatus Colwellbacteria bacterium]|nr:hypothetical protein [Candidatus Colwellbacteria bacterium]